MSKPIKQPMLGANCPINVTKLIESRLLVQANSGSGKSWAIRRLAEQTYGYAQQIIIDPDGEYHTLCEQYDYVLARKGGEAPVDIKSAALLARRLLELNVSAIIDIYELGVQRIEFVKRFLEALVNAPRDLWHPALIILDEAHVYAPEVGSAVSSDAVKNLMALGRKRGFGAVLATQRIAKLSKDAAAEANSKLIGRSALDVDMKRSAGELGFSSREDTQSLRTLQPGQFYAFGPAFTDQVTKIQVGDVKTTHLRAGQRAMAPPPPREKVRHVLAQLANLPHEAEAEAKSVAELQTQVRQLKAELTRAQSVAPAPEVKIVEKPAISPDQFKQLEKALKQIETFSSHLSAVGDKLGESTEAVTGAAGNLRGIGSLLSVALQTARKPVVLPIKQPDKTPPNFKLTPVVDSTSKATNDKLPEGEATILRAAIQFPDGVSKSQLATLTGYKRSTRNLYIQRLRAKGLVDEHADQIRATPEGIASLPDAAPLPTGAALREFWFHKLPLGEKRILELLIESYPSPIAKATIDDMTGFKRSTRNLYLQRLTAKQLITEFNTDSVRATEALF